MTQDQESRATAPVPPQEGNRSKKRHSPEEKAAKEAKRQKRADSRSSQQSKPPESVPEAKGSGKKKPCSGKAGATAKESQHAASAAAAQPDIVSSHAAPTATVSTIMAPSEAGPDADPMSGDSCAPTLHLLHHKGIAACLRLCTQILFKAQTKSSPRPPQSCNWTCQVAFASCTNIAQMQWCMLQDATHMPALTCRP